MSMKKLSLASLLLLSLTACSGGSGGGDSTDPALQQQVNTLQASLAAEQANSAQAQQAANTSQQQLNASNQALSAAETKLSETEQKLSEAQQALQKAQEALNGAPDNRKLQNELASAQAKVAQLEKDLSAAQQNFKTESEKLSKNLETTQSQLAAAQNNATALEKQLAQARAELANAESGSQGSSAELTQAQAKVSELENELATAKQTIAQQKRLLSRQEVYDLAVSVGLPKEWAEEAAEYEQNKTLAEVQNEINHMVKVRTIRVLAQSYGLDYAEARAFEKANRGKTFEEAEELLVSLRAERWNQQQTEQQKRNELYHKLRALNVYGDEANNFINTYLNSDQLETELAKLEKVSQLKQRFNSSLSYYDNDLTNRFVELNLNATEEQVSTNLAKLKETKEVLEEKANGANLTYMLKERFVKDNLFNNETEQNRALAEISSRMNNLIEQAIGKGLEQDGARNLVNSYFYHTEDEFAAELNKRVEEKIALDNYRAELTAMAIEAGLPAKYFSINGNYYYSSVEGFVNGNESKSKAAAKVALENLLKDPEVRKSILANKIVQALKLETDPYGQYSTPYPIDVESLVKEDLDVALQKVEKLAAINQLIEDANIYRSYYKRNDINAFIAQYADKDLSEAENAVNQLKVKVQRVESYIATLEIPLESFASYDISDHLDDTPEQLDEWLGIRKGEISDIRTHASNPSRKIYAQQYSVVVGDDSMFYQDGRYNNAMNIKTIFGEETAVLPQEGRAVYAGKAFIGARGNYEGTFNYNVDFTARKGAGSISGLDSYGEIALQEAAIQQNAIAGTASTADRSGSYDLKFYGPSAEEVAGFARFGENQDVGFGGTRGEIQK